MAKGCGIWQLKNFWGVFEDKLDAEERLKWVTEVITDGKQWEGSRSVI